MCLQDFRLYPIGGASNGKERSTVVHVDPHRACPLALEQIRGVINNLAHILFGIRCGEIPDSRDSKVPCAHLDQWKFPGSYCLNQSNVLDLKVDVGDSFNIDGVDKAFPFARLNPCCKVRGPF